MVAVRSSAASSRKCNEVWLSRAIFSGATKLWAMSCASPNSLEVLSRMVSSTLIRVCGFRRGVKAYTSLNPRRHAAVTS